MIDVSKRLKEKILKVFSNYQNPIELLKDLRDGNINPKEVLKDQINYKSDLGGIRKKKSKLKSKDQISVMQNVQKFQRLPIALA